jgi:hypothetical protein
MIMPQFVPGEAVEGPPEIDFHYQTIKGIGSDDGYYFDLSKNYFYIKNSSTDTNLYDVLNGDKKIDKTWEFNNEEILPGGLTPEIVTGDKNHRGLKSDNYSLLISYSENYSFNDLSSAVTT